MLPLIKFELPVAEVVPPVVEKDEDEPVPVVEVKLKEVVEDEEVKEVEDVEVEDVEEGAFVKVL